MTQKSKKGDRLCPIWPWVGTAGGSGANGTNTRATAAAEKGLEKDSQSSPPAKPMLVIDCGTGETKAIGVTPVATDKESMGWSLRVEQVGGVMESVKHYVDGGDVELDSFGDYLRGCVEMFSADEMVKAAQETTGDDTPPRIAVKLGMTAWHRFVDDTDQKRVDDFMLMLGERIAPLASFESMIVSSDSEASYGAMAIEYGASHVLGKHIDMFLSTGGGSFQVGTGFAGEAAVDVYSHDLGYRIGQTTLLQSERGTEAIEDVDKDNADSVALFVQNNPKFEVPKGETTCVCTAGCFFAAQACGLESGESTWEQAVDSFDAMRAKIISEASKDSGADAGEEGNETGALSKEDARTLSNLSLQLALLRGGVVPKEARINFLREEKVHGQPFKLSWVAGWYLSTFQGF